MTLQPPQPSRHSPTDSKERNYQQIKVRQDTNENWLKNDPKPASGEWCYSIGPLNNPTTRNPAANDPPASKEWYGKFCIDADRNIWECTATSDGASPPNLVYNWEPVLEEGKNVKYTPPAAHECVKIGTSYDRWSQLPWLGGRGPKGDKGNPGDGIRIVGVLTDCGPPSAEQAPDPQIGDMWIVSCEVRDDSTPGSCMAECDGTAWVWDGEAWQFIGTIQGPPGNNVEYYYQEFAATANQTEFQLDSEVQAEATFVTINGVILLPNDYTFEANADGDVLKFLNDIPLKDEDIIMVFSFKGAIDAAVRTLTTADISTLGVRPQELPPVARPEIRNQQQVNWYLMDAVDHLDETVSGTLEDYATQEWVLDQDYGTVEFIDESIRKVVQDQDAVDERQNQELQLLESRVSQIESVSLDARYMFEGSSSIPREGEFTVLSGGEVAEQWQEATGLSFNENALEGKPEWNKVAVGDVIRLGGSTASGIIPASSREADSFAEFRILAVVAETSFQVELIRSASHPIPGVEYGVLLLSSFDPTGLATTEFVIEVAGQTHDASKSYTDTKLKDYIPEAGGNLTGKLNVKSGGYIDASSNSVMNGRSSFNVRIHADRPATFESGSSYKPVLKVLAYKDQGGANSDRDISPFTLYANGNVDTRNIVANGQVKIVDEELKVEKNGENTFRVTENSIIAKLPVTSKDRITAENGITLAGGDKIQGLHAKKGYSGHLVYDQTGDFEQDARLAWGNNTVWLYRQVDMQQNKIIGCGNADLSRGKDVVNVNTLNDVMADVGDAKLSADQTFTGINTFKNEIRPESNTVFNLLGDPSNFQDRHIKVRRGINLTIYCYAGQDNNNAKKCFHATWRRDEPNPEVWINYIPDPTQNGNPVNLRYANATYAKKTDVANVPDATSTTKGIGYLGQCNTGTSSSPNLKRGQLYWNSSKKRLYIGT